MISKGKDSSVEEQVVQDIAETHELHNAKIIDHVAEVKLCRKFDFRILPILAIMYLFNALDKGNLGNAKTDGFDKNIGLVGNQYNIILSVFYVPYVLTAFPVALIGKKFGPSVVLPILMFIFGSMCLLSAAVQNFGGMMTVRWILGMAEAGFFPLVIYYLTTFYRRSELARRLAIFYAASNIANAFSGLLAFGIFQIKGGALQNWRYLFIIEGAASVLFSVFALFYLPRSASHAKFLNPVEKELAFQRIQQDSSSVVDEKLSIRDALKVFNHPTTWVFLLIECALGVPIQGVANFLPQIVGRLGFSTVKTNLYTVAPNICGAVVLLILAFASDITRLRFPFIMIGFAFPVIGFIVYAAIDVKTNIAAAYAMTFLMTSGTSAPSVILSTWYNNNTPSESRRAALTAVGVPLANMMGIVSTQIFRPQDAPAYIPALITTAVFGAVGIVLTGCLGAFMIIDNKRRNLKSGVNLRVQDVSTEILAKGPNQEKFRWFI